MASVISKWLGKKYLLEHNHQAQKYIPQVYLSKSLPIDDKDVCCGFLCTFDDEATFFALVAAASL